MKDFLVRLKGDRGWFRNVMAEDALHAAMLLVRSGGIPYEVR